MCGLYQLNDWLFDYLCGKAWYQNVSVTNIEKSNVNKMLTLNNFVQVL